MKNFFKLAIAVLCVQSLFATDENDTLLIVGARPWDENVQECQFSDLTRNSNIGFVDFLDYDFKHVEGCEFYHADFNNQKMCDAQNLSDLTQYKSNYYSKIIVDWSTYQHMRDPKAFDAFYDLLSDNGNFIVPIFNYDMREKKANSKEKSDQFVSFMKTAHHTFKTVSVEPFDPKALSFMEAKFLTRSRMGGYECALEYSPYIIRAVK